MSGATTGKMATFDIDSPALLNQRVGRFRILSAEACNPRFISLLVQQITRQVLKKAYGAAQPNISPTQIEQIPIPFPPLEEQNAIVAETEKQFTRLEVGVAGLRRVQANLKRYRAAVLKAACEGKLVPTEAELARQEARTYETGTQLLERILTERRQKWNGKRKYKEPAAADTANLSPIPDGWVWASVEQLSTRVQYGTSAKTNDDSTGVPVLRMGNIQDGKFDFAKLKYLPKAHDEFPELLLASGDLLFNRTNSAELVGKTAVFKQTLHPCSFASYLIRVRLCIGCVPDFVSYFINSVFGRAWIANVVSQQVGQANVNGTKLQALAIPLPPLAEQTRIVAEVERRLSVVEELESVVNANLQRASRLRQSILQRAFEGQLANSYRDTTEGAERLNA
ncbi:MAG: restriction endonuclease [Deltaproteobacteria bacterium]|nr:MAG: restriction endonuclease [Deltaproteobacteria bacterium]